MINSILNFNIWIINNEYKSRSGYFLKNVFDVDCLLYVVRMDMHVVRSDKSVVKIVLFELRVGGSVEEAFNVSLAEVSQVQPLYLVLNSYLDCFRDSCVLVTHCIHLFVIIVSALMNQHVITLCLLLQTFTRPGVSTITQLKCFLLRKTFFHCQSIRLRTMIDCNGSQKRYMTLFKQFLQSF
jgi:hypothetical protein